MKKNFALYPVPGKSRGDVYFTRCLTRHLVKGLAPRTTWRKLTISIVVMVVMYNALATFLAIKVMAK